MLPRTADRISFFIKRSRSTFLVTSPMISSGSVAARSWPSHSGTSASGAAGSDAGGPSSEPPSVAAGVSVSPGGDASGTVSATLRLERERGGAPFETDGLGSGGGEMARARPGGPDGWSAAGPSSFRRLPLGPRFSGFAHGDRHGLRLGPAGGHLGLDVLRDARFCLGRFPAQQWHRFIP